MPHLHLWGQALGLVSQPILPLTPLTIQEGQWIITQAITECWIEVRGLGQSHVCILWPHNHSYSTIQEILPKKTTPEMPVLTINHHPTGHREAEIAWSTCRGEQGLISPWPLSPSLDRGFENDRSSVLTASSVSLLLDRSKGSQYSQCGTQCRETRAHMKINLPIFKDEDMQRMPSPIRVGGGTWLDTIMQDAGTVPPFHMPSSPCKGTPEN